MHLKTKIFLALSVQIGMKIEEGDEKKADVIESRRTIENSIFLSPAFYFVHLKGANLKN